MMYVEVWCLVPSNDTTYASPHSSYDVRVLTPPNYVCNFEVDDPQQTHVPQLKKIISVEGTAYAVVKSCEKFEACLGLNPDLCGSRSTLLPVELANHVGAGKSLNWFLIYHEDDMMNMKIA